jgi:hypothetical protein
MGSSSSVQNPVTQLAEKSDEIELKKIQVLDHKKD